MAIPAIAVERLFAHHHRFDRFFMAANAVRLDNPLGFLGGADRNRDVAGGEGIHILGPLSAFFQVIGSDVLMGEMAVHTLRNIPVGGVIPVFILGIHNMAVCAGFRRASPIGRRVGHKDKKAECGDGSQDSKNERKSGHVDPH